MIKKTVAAALIVFGAAAAASAQVVIDTNIVVGLNLCRFEGKDRAIKFDLKAGFTGGALWSVYPADFFGVQAGILYSQKGGIDNTEVDTGTIRTKIAFSYLEVPVVAKLGYLVREDAPFRLYVLGGASYGLKLSSRTVVDFVQEGLETPVYDASLTGYKGGEFSGIVGAGFEFAVKGGGLLFFEGRYSKSLATISSEGFDHRFTVLSFLAGYSF